MKKSPRKRASPSRPLPFFASEAEARAYWESTDSTEHVDWSRAKVVTAPHLKASTTTISLRLPEGMLDELKVLANKRDVPYQSLLKVFLAERLAAERLGVARRMRERRERAE